MEQPSIPEHLRDHLEPGERVLWFGSPSPKLLSLHSLLEIAGTSLLICLIVGGGLFLLLFVFGDLDETLGSILSTSTFSLTERLFWVFTLLSILVVGVVAPALVVLLLSALNWSRRRMELYVITDRGFLWQRSVWLFTRTTWPVHRFPLKEVNALEVLHHADGTGTITFLDEWVSLGEESVNPSFARIPDVDLALLIAYAAAEEAGIPQAERPSGWQVMGRTFINWLVAIVVGSVGAVILCLGAAILLGVAISAQGQDLESTSLFLLLLQFESVMPTAAVVMFVTGFVGLWSLAVRSKLRRYPHLYRLRRLLAWLRVILAVVWVGAMAWIVLTLVK